MSNNNNNNNLQIDDIINEIVKWINKENESNIDDDDETKLVFEQFKNQLLYLYNKKKNEININNNNLILPLKQLKHEFRNQRQNEKLYMEKYKVIRKSNHDINYEINKILEKLINNNNNNNKEDLNNSTSTDTTTTITNNTTTTTSSNDVDIDAGVQCGSLIDYLISDTTTTTSNNEFTYQDNIDENYNIIFNKLNRYDHP